MHSHSSPSLRPNVFLSTINLQNLALAAPEIGVLAIAMMLAMLTGGIDLSLVNIANLSAITMSTLYTSIHGSNPALAEQLTPVLVLAGLAIGLLGGVINAVLVAYVGITPILATLGTMQIYNGIAVVWTGGRTLYGSPATLTSLGQADRGRNPYSLLGIHPRGDTRRAADQPHTDRSEDPAGGVQPDGGACTRESAAARSSP